MLRLAIGSLLSGLFAGVATILVLGLGCSTPIHAPPVVNPDAPSCAGACARLKDCPYNSHCDDLCSASGDSALVACLYAATTCEQADACDH